MSRARLCRHIKTSRLLTRLEHGMKALFLSQQHSLTPGGGGQQQCTREYAEVLRHAGFELTTVSFATDRSWRTRLRRKFRPTPYANLIPEEYFSRMAAAVQEHRPAFVFCNLYNFVPFGPRLRKDLPAETKLVLLSHGLASVDEVHAARIARHASRRTHLPHISDEWIGQMTRIEADSLAAFDHVFCLAAFEVEICRWLGARSVSWCPRTLSADAFVKWKPTGDRVGIVGTIDHPPNFEGIEDFCAALQTAGTGKLRLRLVTQSRRIAADLQARYPFIDDLGPLETSGHLEAEVATWSAFVHPIFCYAMGCSTKVATGLKWGLPVLTTEAGLRGYAWKHGDIPVSSTAKELADRAFDMLTCTRAAALREEVIKAVHSAPSVHEVAAQMRRDLGLDSIGGELHG